MKMWFLWLLVLIVSRSSVVKSQCWDSGLNVCDRVQKMIEIVEHIACHGGGRDVNTEGSYLPGGTKVTQMGETVRQARILLMDSVTDEDFFGCLTGNFSMSYLCQSDAIDCGASDNYRSHDGTCNNINIPRLGSVGTEQERLLDPVFRDYLQMSYREFDEHGDDLPNPRVISTEIFNQNIDNNDEDSSFSMWVWTFAQLADHDIDLTPTIKDKNGKNIDCCQEEITSKCNYHFVCLPIKIPKDDPYFKETGQKCINFVRSASSPCCSQKCNRTPVNMISAYIDAGPTYGNSAEQANDFREDGVNGKGARLKVSDFHKEGSYLFRNKDQENSCIDAGCLDKSKNVPHCMKSGDSRQHVVPSLVSVITLFTREHNRIVDKLRDINPGWDEERLYQEARKIVMAEYQMFTFRDLMAGLVLDEDIATHYNLTERSGYDDVYDDVINAQVSVAFSTAAFRFGHSLINSFHGQFDSLNEKCTIEDPIHNNYNRARMCFKGNGISGIIRYLGHRGMGKADAHMSHSMRNLLFMDLLKNKSLDIGALNILRGRDHGLSPYNVWRRFYGLSPFPASHSQPMVDKIREVYDNRDEEIDLFVGGMTEEKRDGALIGDLFAHMLAEQFSKLKRGDRFYYQNRPDSITDKGRFQSENQVKSLQKLTLARVICENTKTVKIQKDVFRRIGDRNPMISCKDRHAMPDIDFQLWKEK